MCHDYTSTATRREHQCPLKSSIFFHSREVYSTRPGPTRRRSEPESAGSLRGKPSISCGWLRSLTLCVEHVPQKVKSRLRHGLVWAVLALTFCARAADWVELKVDLDYTWQSQARTNRHKINATCIVGSTDWFISGNFSKFQHARYWLVGTNEVERTENRVQKLLEDARLAGPIASYPKSDEPFIRIYPCPQGKPVFNGVAGLVWLALCSANYLGQPDRQIPMPISVSPEAYGYLDRTILLQQGLGLPKRVVLFKWDGVQPVCKYEVLEATNYLGRVFPLKFSLIQSRQPVDGAERFSSLVDVRGEVSSIGPGKLPDIPPEARMRLEK